MSMVRKLYVGNIAYSATEEDVKELFSDYGKVLAFRFVLERGTNKSRGFGFVEMSTPREAADALARLDGVTFQNRQLRVGEALPRKTAANLTNGNDPT